MPTSTISAIIADDEAPLRAYLKQQLAELWPELMVSGEASDGPQALALIQKTQPDVAFLDIRMPGASGLEVAAQLNHPCHVVFITAYDEYAVQAFDAAAADYLLKPVDLARLSQTVERLQQRLENNNPMDLTTLIQQLSTSIQTTPDYLQWLQVARQDDVYIVAIDEVDYFQAADKYTAVVTVNQEWLIKTSLKDLETSLDPNLFWRIHRGTIVRVGAIARVSRDFRGRYQLVLHKHSENLTVSRAYNYHFRQM